ncbi:unnamed protein product [Choristocarpus tenellus]
MMHSLSRVSHLLSHPKDACNASMDVCITIVLCVLGIPLRLFALWVIALSKVWVGDREGNTVRKAARDTVFQGRGGGDFDLSRVLFRHPRSEDSPEGLTVSHLKQRLEDHPLLEGGEMLPRNLDNPCTLRHFQLLAKSTRDAELRVVKHLNALERSISETLRHLDEGRDTQEPGVVTRSA